MKRTSNSQGMLSILMPVNFTPIDDKESNLKNADFSKEEWKHDPTSFEKMDLPT